MLESGSVSKKTVINAASGKPFISYAQNYEDVMLRRAFRDVVRGQYLDVGAGEPEADSVTKAFYDLDWHGVNVEPLAGPFRRLCDARPRDLTLNVAVGFAIGEAALLVVGDESGLSTLDQGLAAQHQEAGWALQEVRVPVTTLKDICTQHVQGDLHFLKIDAEGAELDILRGADFSQCRPWVILLEAVDPVDQSPAPFQDWECEVLTPNNYLFAYDDGLNRFYIAGERENALRPAFRVPPNVFDNFVRVSEVTQATSDQLRQQVEEITRLETLLHSAQERADWAQSRVHAAQSMLEQSEMRAMHAETAARDTAARAEEHIAKAEERTAEAEARAALHDPDEIKRLLQERDVWAQELFEANRHAAELTVARQVLTDEVAHLHTLVKEAQEATAEREAARASETAELNVRLAATHQNELSLAAQLASAMAQLATARRDSERATGELAAAKAEAHLAATHLESAHAQQSTLREALAEVQRERDQSLLEKQDAVRWVTAIKRSTSWRLTRPLRGTLRLLGRG